MATRRSGATEEGGALTVAEVCERYLEAARAGLVVTNKKRPKSASTLAVDEGRVARHIVPLLGKHVANSLAGRTDIVQRFYDDVAAGKTATKIKNARARRRARHRRPARRQARRRAVRRYLDMGVASAG